MITIYHNTRCSKSRCTLDILEEKGQSPKVVHYLETPPDAKEIKKLLKLLGIPARELLRKGEPEYKELGLGNPDLSEAELIAAMAAHPRLIERPIVSDGQRAVIGRPPEKVLELLK